MEISKREVEILRSYAFCVAELADTQRNNNNITLWNDTTGLKSNIKPATLVHLWRLSWEEVLPDSDLECTSELAQYFERDMRRRIWSIENLEDDAVIEPVITYPHCVNSTLR